MKKEIIRQLSKKYEVKEKIIENMLNISMKKFNLLESIENIDMFYLSKTCPSKKKNIERNRKIK